MHGSVSYASQDPWLFPATIRQNILFGEEYDQERYDEVVRVCALAYDFSLFDDGDLTVVADKGMNLSKGQQARINLARAVYRQSNIYLFDDSLTALDSNVQDYIFNKCLLNFLNDKICILVSQNPVHIEKSDRVVILSEGRMLYSGDSKNAEQKIVDSIIQSANEEMEKEENREVVRNSIKQFSIRAEQQETKKNVYKEIKKKGKVDVNIYYKYFQYGGGLIFFACIILIYVGSQFIESSADKLLTTW